MLAALKSRLTLTASVKRDGAWIDGVAADLVPDDIVQISVGDVVNAKVDAERRARTVRNHSSTHLMHKALREVLGEHVQQKGSLVDADKTRFDFAHNAPLTDEQIREYRGTLSEPGKASPFRKRGPEENLALLRKMKAKQASDRLAAGRAWRETGLILVNEIGDELRPEVYSDRCRRRAGSRGSRRSPTGSADRRRRSAHRG